MASKYLNGLNDHQRKALQKELHSIQNGKCFISDELIDLSIHERDLDIDHVIPLSLGGKDDRSNFALTFSSANRSKQDSDLNVARVIHRFYKIREQTESEGRSPNLDDILLYKGGAKYPLTFKREGNTILYSLSQISCNEIVTATVFEDKLSKNEYFFAVLPIEFIFHDSVINPRSIGKNVSGLISEFYKGNPQLHIALGWIDITESNISNVHIFDGQHKAAAQLLLDVKYIPVRIFINPDKDKLVQTNFKAGTTLRQVAFDKSVQRHLGNTIFRDRVFQYQKEHGYDIDFFDFSERDLLEYFKGEAREMKRYIIDAQRFSIKQDQNNELNRYIDDGGRATDKPLSYSTIEKTFFSFFINGEPLTTNISFGMEDGSNPREIERRQIVELMNIVAEEILVDKFDFTIGSSRVENKVRAGESLPLDHLRAHRMCREEILHSWLDIIKQVVRNYFAYTGTLVNEKCLFETEFPLALSTNIRNAVRNISNMPLWMNTELSIFGGKQVADYWKRIFATGKTPEGIPVLTSPININEIIQSS